MEQKYKCLDLKISKLVSTQKEKSNDKTQFYPTVVNNTDISFTNEEMILMNKGLKYNLNQKSKHWLSNLALEAKVAVSLLPLHEQDYTRYQVAQNLPKLYK